MRRQLGRNVRLCACRGGAGTRDTSPVAFRLRLPQLAAACCAACYQLIFAPLVAALPKRALQLKIQSKGNVPTKRLREQTPARHEHPTAWSPHRRSPPQRAGRCESRRPSPSVWLASA